MSSRWTDRLRHTLGFRVALWYALLFVAGALKPRECGPPVWPAVPNQLVREVSAGATTS